MRCGVHATICVICMSSLLDVGMQGYQTYGFEVRFQGQHVELDDWLEEYLLTLSLFRFVAPQKHTECKDRREYSSSLYEHCVQLGSISFT